MSRFMIQRGRSRGRGRYEEARDEYARALEATVTAHGEWSGAAARLQNDMGVVEWRLGNLAQAETLYRRALAIQEELGEEAQDIAPVLNNLATLLCDQDRYDMALPLHRRAVEVDERRLGPDHPDLALTLNNLAALYCEHGKAAEAAAMHRRALAIQQKVRRFRRRSAGRVLTARSPSFVTLPPHRLRDVSAAEVAHFSRIVSLSLSLSLSLSVSTVVRGQTLGRAHPATAATLHALGLLLTGAGSDAEAERVLRGALAVREATLGEDHLDTAQSVNGLGLALAGQVSQGREIEPQG
jgi:tetratricopeptide (TPR) repeat protein